MVTTLPDWARRPVYEVYWRSFQDSRWNGDYDGIGDLAGLTSRINYLEWLGVDIWLTPFFASPMKDGGYDVSNYMDVHPAFGTIGAMKAFLRTCNARGIRVIIDLVGGHTSDQHPWFQQAITTRSRRPWYYVRHGQGGSPPNNWQSKFGGPAWTLLPGSSDDWYLHTWGAFQPQLNLGSKRVRRALQDVLAFWFDLGVAGARMDYVPNAIPDARWRDNPPNPDYAPGMPETERLLTSRTEYLPGMYDFVADMVNTMATRYPDSFLLPEAYPAHLGTNPLAYDQFYRRINPDHGAPLNFSLMFVPKTAAAMKSYLDEFFVTLPGGAVPVFSLSNHDRIRPADLDAYGPALAMALLVMMLALPGMPTIYYGQELNMRNGHIPPRFREDPEGPRDQYRTPMQWTAAVNGGFTGEGTSAWLPVTNPRWCNVSDQSRDPDSPLNLTRRMLRLRSSLPAFTGTYLPLPLAAPDVLAFQRSVGNDKATVLVNFSSQPVTLDRPPQGSLAVATSGGSLTRSRTEPLRLSGYEAQVFVT